MKVSDYIVNFLIEKGITDVFGYPGGMVIHLMDSFSKKEHKIKAHVNYNEQGSSFAACGYSQVALKPGVAYATSGPGATNLITGVCNAYFDSIPTIFITGQVNTYESKGNLEVRQKGFQETDIVSMVKDVTKHAVRISDAKDIRYHLEKAYELSIQGRPGPVLLDIPMNIQRADIQPDELIGCVPTIKEFQKQELAIIMQALEQSNRPCILVGAGVRQSGMKDELRRLITNIKVPVVTSMIAVDVISSDDLYNFGFAGAYGNRHSNFILSKCDLLITLGSRLDFRQTGVKADEFAMNAKLIRIDVDEDELSNRIKDNEIQIVRNLKEVIPLLNDIVDNSNIDFGLRYSKWIEVCTNIKTLLSNKDNLEPNNYMKSISMLIPDESIITTDVGQNQVWVSQSFNVKNAQRILFSGGHGAMGYSLPAAIGAYYAGNGKKVYSINGDGGIQMNIQELQFIAREKLPITIIIFNNQSLGMIRHFQEMYCESNYAQTVAHKGYKTPQFSLIAKAYGLEYYLIEDNNALQEEMFNNNRPCIIEIALNETTYVFPKLAINKPIQDQEPQIDRALYQYIIDL